MWRTYAFLSMPGYCRGSASPRLQILLSRDDVPYWNGASEKQPARDRRENAREPLHPDHDDVCVTSPRATPGFVGLFNCLHQHKNANSHGKAPDEGRKGYLIWCRRGRLVPRHESRHCVPPGPVVRRRFSGVNLSICVPEVHVWRYYPVWY